MNLRRVDPAVATMLVLAKSTAPKRATRTFEVHRDEDESGVSGTGHVADGCEFDDGSVVLRWRGENASTTHFPSMAACEKVHGHSGKTRFVFTESVDVKEAHRATLTLAEEDVEYDADGAPIAFRMWRAGLNRTDHGDHYLTKESIETLLEQQAARGNLFSFDVDHLSLSETAPPEARKAVGFFKIDERNGDLWVVGAEWTDVVRSGLTKRPPEWRYFSPAYETKKKTGEIVRLLNCALTNNPATHHVTALATTAGTSQKGSKAMGYDEMTLSALLAAMDEEKDEGKKKEMEKVARAKFAAAFPSSDDKKDEKKEETKAGEAPSEKKEETKANGDGDGDEKKAESIAATVTKTVLANVDKAMREKEEKAELDRILARLPEGDRKDYEGLPLAAVKKLVAKHHSDVLTTFAAAGTAMPTQGTSRQVASMLPPSEKEALDRKMGIERKGPFVQEVETMLVFDPLSTKADASAVLASLAKARSESKNDGEVFTRVLSTMKGGTK